MNRRMIVDVSSLVRRYCETMEARLINEAVMDRLFHLKRAYRLTEIILAFDGKNSSGWRKQLYASYKSGRPVNMDARLAIRSFFRWAGSEFHREVVPGYEADDIIACMTRHISEHDPSSLVIIYSSDHDMFQLLAPNVKQLLEYQRDRPARWMTEDMLAKKHGLTPKQWTDYRILVGDATDKIAGVADIGAKTAKIILKHAGSLDNALTMIDSLPIRSGLRERLQLYHESGDIDVLRQVVGFRFDAPIKYSLAPKEKVSLTSELEQVTNFLMTEFDF